MWECLSTPVPFSQRVHEPFWRSTAVDHPYQVVPELVAGVLGDPSAAFQP